MARRAEIIGIGAIKFYLLRVRPTQSINFDPAESISFDGFTGPYCQYAYARICGILEKAKNRPRKRQDPDYSLLGKAEEVQLLQKLIEFPQEVESAAEDLNPSKIAVHIFNTAKAFNQFYNQCHILRETDAARQASWLALAQFCLAQLELALSLLGVEVPERM